MNGVIERLQSRIDMRYRDKSVLTKQKALYLTLISIIVILTGLFFLIWSLGHNNRIPLIVMIMALVCGFTSLILVYYGHIHIARIIYAVMSLNELIFLLNPASPDIVIAAEVAVISFILILLASIHIHYILIFIYALTVVFFRIYYLDSGSTQYNHIVMAYICVLVILLFLFFVAVSLRKNIRNQEMLIQDQKDKIFFYEKIRKMEADLVEQGALLDGMQHRLYLDDLTGLFNRKAFKDLYHKYIHNSRRNNLACTLSYIDIDHLKYVNDTYDHSAGDLYLKIFSDSVTEHIRDNDYAFRVGGDEFIIIFDGCDKDVARKILKRVEKLFAVLVHKKFPEVRAGFSSGSVNLNENQGISSEELVKKADYLMLKEKKERRVDRGKL